jgi:hypothetical protein
LDNLPDWLEGNQNGGILGKPRFPLMSALQAARNRADYRTARNRRKRSIRSAAEAAREVKA